MRAPEYRTVAIGEGAKPSPHGFRPFVAVAGAASAPNGDVVLATLPVADQQNREACTGLASLTALWATLTLAGLAPDWNPSAWLAWTLGRMLLAPGWPLSNIGTSLLGVVAAFSTWGIGRAGTLVNGSDVTIHDPTERPDIFALCDADLFKIIGPTTITSSGAKRVIELRSALDAGCGVAGAAWVDHAFDAYDGSKPLGAVDVSTIRGSHAIACIGYRRDTGAFLLRNSWGARWGIAGDFEADEAFVSTMTELHPMTIRRAT